MAIDDKGQFIGANATVLPNLEEASMIKDLCNFSLSDFIPDATSRTALLARREELTTTLLEEPYSIHLYLSRSHIYDLLGYPDLAAMDAYKALLLVDDVLDEAGEYHEVALESLCGHIATLPVAQRLEQASNDETLFASLQSDTLDEVPGAEGLLWARNVFGIATPVTLAHHLASIGCLRTACEYAQTTLSAHPSNALAQAALTRIHSLASSHFASKQIPFDPNSFDLQNLPDQGSVRREVYPWNTHEADRHTPEALEILNAEMKLVARKLEVRVTSLPVLSEDGSTTTTATVKQLGVFAAADIAPGEEVLRERSLLTANSSLHEPLCDACSSALPSLPSQDQGDGPTSCPSCPDTIFCSRTCLALAQESYHAAICGVDAIESVGKIDVSAQEAPAAMYTLLVLRALAMALTRRTHPLDLAEIRYIWGDFVPVPLPGSGTSDTKTRTLPFSFASAVLTPLHFLTLLDVDIFSPANSPSLVLSSNDDESAPTKESPFVSLTELWLLNTLFAKLRATASARMSTRTFRPEVAAVHPLWCLANHSCDPNVRWEWAGEVAFTAVRERVEWGGAEGRKGVRREGEERRRRESEGSVGVGGRAGRWAEEKGEGEVLIRRGEEVLNHYVDVSLPVGERREWGAGALGGVCMCERCVWEAAQE